MLELSTVARHLKVLGDLNVLDVLIFLGPAPATANEIAERMGVADLTVTGIMQRLTSAGMIVTLPKEEEKSAYARNRYQINEEFWRQPPFAAILTGVRMHSVAEMHRCDEKRSKKKQKRTTGA